MWPPSPDEHRRSGQRRVHPERHRASWRPPCLSEDRELTKPLIPAWTARSTLHQWQMVPNRTPGGIPCSTTSALTRQSVTPRAPRRRATCPESLGPGTCILLTEFCLWVHARPAIAGWVGLDQVGHGWARPGILRINAAHAAPSRFPGGPRGGSQGG
eukprot:gene2144-biopygen22965